MTSPWPTLDACFRDCTGSRKLNNLCMQNRTEMVKDLTLKARFSQEQCFPLHLSHSPTSSAVLSENITHTVPWGEEGKDTVPGVSSARMEFQMSQKPLCGNVPLWWASRFLYLYLPGPEELPRSRQKLWLQSAKTSPQTNLSNWKKAQLTQTESIPQELEEPCCLTDFPQESLIAGTTAFQWSLLTACSPGFPKWLCWCGIF